MNDNPTRSCMECQGQMAPIVIMDKQWPLPNPHRHSGVLEYRLADDSLSFWTGKYPTAGPVQAFMCASCGRIALYGEKRDA